jgi:methylase of polypeptide subunit release factors
MSRPTGRGRLSCCRSKRCRPRSFDLEEHTVSAIRWTESDTSRTARWHSENSTPPPEHVVIVDDRTKADQAYRLARQGTALLWRGDFHNARQLLRAIDRRNGQPPLAPHRTAAEAFRLHREHQGRRARLLGRLLVRIGADHTLDLRRAPDVRQACTETYGPPAEAVVVSLTELQGVLSAHQWRRNGVPVHALGGSVFPHYGVFAPVRGEYIDLVAAAPLPSGAASGKAFDLGTGTGVLAAVLAQRGVPRIVATDIGPRALACAEDNMKRLGFAERVDLVGPRLYPDGRADLVVCNPPWLPGRPTSELEQGVYDRDGAMLHEFLTGLAGHLNPGGEGWLVLSDLAEHLGLRSRGDLLDAIERAGLGVIDRTSTRPRHPRSANTRDPLHAERSKEVTSLWRLAPLE